MSSARFLIASTLIASSLASTQAHAWVPCVLICDAACMGISFTNGTVEAQEAFSKVEQSFIGLAETIAEASEEVTNLSNKIESDFDKTAKSVQSLVNEDDPLTSSLTTKLVRAVSAATVKLELEAISNQTLRENNALELINSTNSLFHAYSKIHSQRLTNSETSDIFDSVLQNSYEISNHFETKAQNLKSEIMKSALLTKGMSEKVIGMNSIKSRKIKEANEHFEDLIFLQSNDMSPWKITPLISRSPSNLSAAITKYMRLSSTAEIRNTDIKAMVGGKHIDLIGINLSKIQRRNLYMYELMQSSKNLSIFGDNYEY
ncbi:hypothetical protein [Marinomonas sp. 2405UD68-3]|uniref:hypothetical protein n=1 Tax=Marinomonas sp. 2405UD68-3 TaxID=3391835 RepID=UPI0039C98B9F